MLLWLISNLGVLKCLSYGYMMPHAIYISLCFMEKLWADPPPFQYKNRLHSVLYWLCALIYAI